MREKLRLSPKLTYIVEVMLVFTSVASSCWLAT